MAKIEAEMRQYLEKVGHGEEVTMYKFKTSIHGEDCHYPGELISGAKMMEKCIDCCTELSSIRDEDPGLWVDVHASCLSMAHMLDTFEIIVWVKKVGNSSRLYGFEMYKTSEFDLPSNHSEIFDEPVLAMKGEVTFVIGRH